MACAGVEKPWVSLLNGARAEEQTAGSAPCDEDAVEAEVQGRLSDLIIAQQTQWDLNTSSTAASLPAFYKRPPARGSISAAVSKEAQLRFLQLRHEMLLDNRELENLYFVLQQFAEATDQQERYTPEVQRVEDAVDYERYCQISVRCAELFGEKSLQFFTPSTFLLFKRDSHGRISILPLFHYIMRKVSMQQTRIYLSYHDSSGRGHLTERDLEAYVDQADALMARWEAAAVQMIPSLPLLATLEANMVGQYKRIALRSLMFFNDPHRRGRVRTADLLVSKQLAEFLELRHEVHTAQAAARLSNNWFSLHNARRVYTMFLELDEDMDGLLSQAEFLAFSDGGLSRTFVDLLFHEHVHTWPSRCGRPRSGAGQQHTKMDFPCFLEFLLAWESKKHPVSLGYFFRTFDHRARKGHLTREDLHVLFSDVHQMWAERGEYEINGDDIKDEVFDMVAPAAADRITLADLVRCKMGDTVVSMLSDVNGFWRYDSRESLLAQQDAEEEQ